MCTTELMKMLKVCKWGSTVCSSDWSRENRESRERGRGRWVWGECEEEIDYGKGRKNYQRHFDLLQQSLFPLFLSLEKMQHKQQHVAFKHQVTTVWGKERGKDPQLQESEPQNQRLNRNKTHRDRAMKAAHTMREESVESNYFSSSSLKLSSVFILVFLSLL